MAKYTFNGYVVEDHVTIPKAFDGKSYYQIKIAVAKEAGEALLFHLFQESIEKYGIAPYASTISQYGQILEYDDYFILKISSDIPPNLCVLNPIRGFDLTGEHVTVMCSFFIGKTKMNSLYLGTKLHEILI